MCCVCVFQCSYLWDSSSYQHGPYIQTVCRGVKSITHTYDPYIRVSKMTPVYVNRIYGPCIGLCTFLSFIFTIVKIVVAAWGEKEEVLSAEGSEWALVEAAGEWSTGAWPAEHEESRIRRGRLHWPFVCLTQLHCYRRHFCMSVRVLCLLADNPKTSEWIFMKFGIGRLWIRVGVCI